MAHEVVVFGDVTVDLRRVSVLRAGQPVSLEPKTFDVLRYFIEHRDRLVTKEELLDTVWKDTFVTPNVLTRAVAQLRKALGDDAFEARYVETVAKRGYRFIASVTVRHEPAALPPPLSLVPPVSNEGGRQRRASIIPVIAATVLLAAVGLAVFAFRDRGAIESRVADTPLSLRRFTTGSHSYSFPAISPDGRTVAYSSDQTGEMEIYTSGFAPGSKETPITSDGGHNMNADWSPDGQWIAYHSRKKGGIWIVPSSGGTARQIVDFGSQPAWMPDGRQLVFTSGSEGMAAQSVLWIVNRETGERREVTKMGAPRGGHSKPSVSPDGRFVVFSVSQGHTKAEIWTAPIGGGSPTSLGVVGPTGFSLGVGGVPRFSPDGRAVYWIGRTPEGNDVLMRASIDHRAALTAAPQPMQQFAGNFVGGFSIARDGTTAFSLFRGLANLWAVDVPASGKPAPPVPLTSDEVRSSQPRHSGDGRIAFHQIGQPPTVWLMDEDGKERHPLTVGLPRGVWGPQWFPDNGNVFVVLASPNNKPSFASLDVATRRLTSRALPAEGILSPHLSPDGRELAFHLIDEGGVINVWTQPLEGGPRKQVTFDAEAMSYPVWSPDGQSIAVETKRGDHTYIAVIPRDGGTVEMLVTEDGQSWPFSWAPDNDRIAFAGERNGVWNIYYVSRRTKEIRQLTDFTSVEGYVRYPDWSRTRSRIVFERAEQTGSLWTMKLP